MVVVLKFRSFVSVFSLAPLAIIQHKACVIASVYFYNKIYHRKKYKSYAFLNHVQMGKAKKGYLP